MNYLIQIVELVKHHRLPEWALLIIAEVKMYYGDYPVTERDSVLLTIDRMIDGISFTLRNTKTSGDVIPTSIEDKQMTIFSLTGDTPYLKIFFKPTKREKIIDPFSI